MSFNIWKFVLRVCTVLVVCGGASAQPALLLVPVANHADGTIDPGVVIGVNSMSMPSGDRNVFLEIRIGDWDFANAGVQLRSFQWFIDAGGYSNSGPAELSRNGITACNDHSDCITAFGNGTQCGVPGAICDIEQDCCSGGFVDVTRPDFAMAGIEVICAADLSLADTRTACTGLFEGVDAPDPFPEGGAYCGTLVVYVPADARGSFTIDFLLEKNLLLDQNFDVIGSLIPVPVVITVQTGSCCYAIGAAGDCIDNVSAEDCDALDGPRIFRRDQTCADMEDECGPPATNRYLAIATDAPSASRAVRVSFTDLPAPFDTLNGRSMWVGEPFEISENGHSLGPAIPGYDDFLVASLQCDPFFADWSQYGEVQVFDYNVIPDATYTVEFFDEGEPPTPSVDVLPLNLHTSLWGDVVGPYDAEAGYWTAPDGTVDVTSDVLAMVETFVSKPGFPRKTRIDVEPTLPDGKVYITDIMRVIGAFQGLPYPFEPQPFPCD